ncbi:MAG: fibronectin type III domain-containing protein, partial [Acidimicrobiales bacterium]
MVATLDSHGPAVVVGDRAGHLYAYHLSDGSPVAGWPESDDGGPIDSTPSVAPLNGSNLDSVFVGTGDAHDPSDGAYEAYGPTGQRLWDTTAPEKAAGVQASLTVGDLQGSTDVFAGTLGHLAYALSATSGSVLARWPFFTADTVFSTAAVGDLYGSGQEELVVGGASTHGTAFGVQYQNGGHLRVLDAQGQLIYDYNTNQEVDSSPAVGQFLPGGATGIVVGTGSYYAGASDTKEILAFTDRLVPVWSQTLDGCTASSPALVAISGQLDVVEGTDEGPANCGGTDAGSVYLLNGQTGDVLWHEPVAGRVIGSVVAADLTGEGQPDLLVPTTHGVEVLTEAGQEVTVLAPDLGLQNSPLVTADANGTIGITVAGYNGNDQGVIRHFEIPDSDGAAMGSGSSPSSGSWPMFHHDTSLSGTSAPLPYLGTLTPTDLVAKAGNGEVRLSWAAPGTGEATGYNVYEGTSPGQWGTPVNGQWTPVNGAMPITGTGYTVSGLRNGTRYYYMVTALESAGEGAPSNETNAVPRAFYPAFTADSPPTSATVGATYGPYTFVARGHPTPTFRVSSGTLPPGLTLGTKTGVLSGTPESARRYTFELTATNSAGSTTSSPITITVGSPTAIPYSPVPPTRICDTRTSNPSHLSGEAAQCNGHTIRARGTLTVKVAGEGFGVPAGAKAVVMNVTVVNPAGPGYLTLW